MTRKGEGYMMRFSDLDLTSYARIEMSGKRRSEGGISLPDRVEATMGVIMYMATLAMDENTQMGRETLFRVETQWGRPFQRVKEGINHFYVTNRRVAETETFEEEFIKRFNADLMRLGEEVRMIAMKLKRMGTNYVADGKGGRAAAGTDVQTDANVVGVGAVAHQG